MGSRAERRARRAAKITEYKKAFKQALIDNPKIDVDKPIYEIRHAIIDTLRVAFEEIAKKTPNQEHGTLREAMDQTVAELCGKRNPDESPA